MTLSTRSLVLNHVWNNPGAHRREIAAHYSLHPNLVSDAVKALIKERWVIEGESKKSLGGRAPIALYLDAGRRAAFCVSYSSSSMTCGLVNAAGEILRSKTIAHDRRLPGDVADLAGRQLAGLKKGYRGVIIGTAVADPGMIDQRKGEVVRSSSFPGWHNIAIASMFREKTGLDTIVTDITHARAVAQYRILASRRHTTDTMLYVDYGAGIIGFAFLTPEGIWRGEGFAGEVGHVVLDPEGQLCRCGARGCLESIAGSRALEANAASLLKKGVHSVLSGKDHPGALEIFRAAKGGDRFARTVVRGTLADIGRCTAILVAMLHPRLLVVGAESEDAIVLVSSEIGSAIQSRLPHEIVSTVKIIQGRPTNSLGLIGAGFMLFERVIRFEGKTSQSKG